MNSTPILMIQGLADRLTKPQGTFDMFKSIPNTDKTLLVIGEAEHLIFETEPQDEIMLRGLSAWIDKHAGKNPHDRKVTASKFE